MGREIRAEQASLGFCLPCRPAGWSQSETVGKTQAQGGLVTSRSWGCSLTLTVLSSWTQVYLSVNFLLETLVIRQLWDD